MSPKTTLTVIGAAVVILVAGNALWSRVDVAMNGLPPKAPPPGAPAAAPDSGRMAPFGRGGPMGDGPMFSEEERLKMAKEIGLSEEQQAKMQELMSQPRPEGREGWRDRMQAMREIMTPEQQAKAFQVMRSRGDERMRQRLEQARKSLSPEEFAKLEAKMKQNRERMMSGRSPFPGVTGMPFGGPRGLRGGTSTPGGPGGEVPATPAQGS